MIYVIYFSDAGAPITGLTPTIDIYKQVSDGTDVTPIPTISEIGGGFYKFTAVPTQAIVVRTDGGVSLDTGDRYKVLQITSNDDDLDAPISSRATLGAGSVAWTYTLTRSDNSLPIADADIWVSTDVAGTNVVASGRTDQNGTVTFTLDTGTIYVWRQKSGFTFVNPDLEEVS